MKLRKKYTGKCIVHDIVLGALKLAVRRNWPINKFIETFCLNVGSQWTAKKGRH